MYFPPNTNRSFNAKTRVRVLLARKKLYVSPNDQLFPRNVYSLPLSCGRYTRYTPAETGVVFRSCVLFLSSCQDTDDGGFV